MRAHVEAEPPLPSARNPKVPAALDEIVRKAVAKDPAMRFQSADEFGLALLSVVAVAPAGDRSSKPPGYTPDSAPTTAFARTTASPSARRDADGGGVRHAGDGPLCDSILTAGRHARESRRRRRRQPSRNRQQRQQPSTPAERQVPTVVPPPPPEVPLETAKPAAVLRPRAPLSAPARRANKPEKSYAIRVSGADLQPAATRSPHPPAPVHLSEAPEPSLQPADPVEESGTVTLPAASEVVPGLTTPQEATPPKPPGQRAIASFARSAK